MQFVLGNMAADTSIDRKTILALSVPPKQHSKRTKYNQLCHSLHGNPPNAEDQLKTV